MKLDFEVKTTLGFRFSSFVSATSLNLSLCFIICGTRMTQLIGSLSGFKTARTKCLINRKHFYYYKV